MSRISASLVGVVAAALLVGCGSDEGSPGVRTADVAAVMVSTDDNTRVAEVSMTIRSANDDELRGAAVDASSPAP